MRCLNLGPAPTFGSTPYSTERGPEAEWDRPTPLGVQTGHRAARELGTTHVNLFGPEPVDRASYSPRPEHMAYADEQWRRQLPGYGRPALRAPQRQATGRIATPLEPAEYQAEMLKWLLSGHWGDGPPAPAPKQAAATRPGRA